MAKKKKEELEPVEQDVAVVAESPAPDVPETAPSRREQLMARLQERYPDEDFSDENAVAGRVLDDYDDLQQRHDAMKADEDKLSALFDRDPKAATFMQRWIDGSDPAVELVRLYGDEELRAALDDPAKQDELAKASKEYAERVAKDRDFEQKYQQQLGASLDAMDAFQAEKNLTDDEMDALLGAMAQSATDFIEGKITPEALEAALKSSRFDAEVATAEREGEVRGRNQKIEAKLRKRGAGDGVPELSSRNQKAEPPRRPLPDLGALEQASRGRDIWAGMKRTKY